MRVLVVHNAYQQRGGEDVAAENETALLRDYGCDVDLMIVSNDAVAGFGAKARAALDVTDSATGRRLVAERIAAFRPDIVQVHNFFPLLSPSIFDSCIEAGVPVVQSLHNFRLTCAAGSLTRNGRVCEDCVGGSPHHAVINRCYRGSFAGSLALAHMIRRHQRRGTWRTKVDHFFVLTDFARDIFVRAGVPRERISLKANYAPCVANGSPTRPRQGVLYAGRLAADKGLRLLLAAWAHLDVPLRIAGTGPLSAELAAIAPSHVTLLGKLDAGELRREMEAAAALILPSTAYEGLPMVIVEAFSLGLPVLASRLGGLVEIVEEGSNGHLFAPGDPADIAAVVRRTLADPAALQRLSYGARRSYDERYCADAVARTLLGTYRSVIDRYHGRSAASAAAVTG